MVFGGFKVASNNNVRVCNSTRTSKSVGHGFRSVRIALNAMSRSLLVFSRVSACGKA